MVDWEALARDFEHKPLLYPLFEVYHRFMNIKRYDRMPFYLNETQAKYAGFEGTVIAFLDWLVDAHEQERNRAEKCDNFYTRTEYVANNYPRYMNESLGNIMYDTKAARCDYDILFHVNSQGLLRYYLSNMAIHTTLLAGMSFFFRGRRVSFRAASVASVGYFFAFTGINQLTYKLLVDSPLQQKARELGYG